MGDKTQQPGPIATGILPIRTKQPPSFVIFSVFLLSSPTHASTCMSVRVYTDTLSRATVVA